MVWEVVGLGGFLESREEFCEFLKDNLSCVFIYFFFEGFKGFFCYEGVEDIVL